MLIDARSVPSGTVLETDVCIVGAGAAGITLAREFIDANFQVTLLESGGLDYEPETQSLYEGRAIGLPFQNLMASRLRFFGGTTNHWGGWCLPYDPIDFEERESFPHSGWPFGRSDLDSWYQRAQEVCQLGPYDYAPASWGIQATQITPPFNGPTFVCKILQHSPIQFSIYRNQLKQAQNITVYLYANALRFTDDSTEAKIKNVPVKTLDGNDISVLARVYILATGGIENARMLLVSEKAGNHSFGNAYSLVGRHFMVNLNYVGGVIALADPYTNLDFFTGRAGEVFSGFGKKHEFVSFIGLSGEATRQSQLSNMKTWWLYKLGAVSETLDALKRFGHESSAWKLLSDYGRIVGDISGLGEFTFRKIFFHEGVPVDGLILNCCSEQLPIEESRITLDVDRDALGLEKVVVDWRLTAEDKRRASKTMRLLGAEVGRVGLGRLQSFLKDDDTTWPDDFYGDEHHMGTTRMNPDPQFGVVDQNCRVHGLSNLYVAGSSVFPSSSASNPTLTIVALALRLAAHIKGQLA
jgi:choline dehydrogenase-like flavoprotein